MQGEVEGAAGTSWAAGQAICGRLGAQSVPRWQRGHPEPL